MTTDLTPERWRRISEILDGALDLPEQEIPGYLDRACEGDAELRARVGELLSARHGGASLIDDPTGALRSLLAPLSAPASRPLAAPAGAGSDLGDFEILREIGRGGMGVVYEARQISLNRRVALKVLPPALGLNAEAVTRFEREARAAAQLHHTNIVPVHATGAQQGSHYYAMELVEGPPLSRILEELEKGGTNVLLDETLGPSAPAARTGEDGQDLPPQPPPRGPVSRRPADTSSSSRAWFDTVARLIAEVAEALDHAHSRGIVHRDVKPANLLYAPAGHLCVSDFGLARLSQEPGLTVTGTFLGTPSYMSPEQVAAGRMKLDHRTDIYSLGVVLYEMLTLRRPFPGAHRDEVVAQILTKDPDSPRRLNPRVPLDLETICQKAMEKDPDRRYATAARMASDLRQHLARGLISARRAGPLRRALKWARRHPLGITAALATMVVVATATMAWRTSVARHHEVALRTLGDARLDLGRGEYREALRKVEEALALEPLLPEGRLLHARLLIKLGRTDEAIAGAKAILDQAPDDWTAHLVLASATRGSEGTRFGTSIEEHVRAVEAGAPGDAEALFLRSLMAATDTEALELLDRALEIDPGHAEALAERIDRRLNLYRFSEALTDCDRLIAVRPRSAQARMKKAKVYMTLNDPGRASEEIERGMKLDPDNAELHLTRGMIHHAIDAREAAMADYSRSIEIDSRNATAFVYRGQLYVDTGRRDEALADFERALDLNPENLLAYMGCMSVHVSNGESEIALSYARRLREAAARWTDARHRAMAHLELAFTLIDVGEVDSALAEVEEAGRLDPGSWRIPAMRARVHRLRNEPDALQVECARVAREVLAEPSLLRERGLVLETICDRPDLALADLSLAIASAPEWADIYYDRGTALLRLDRLAEALADFDRAVSAAPAWSRPRTLRARVYYEMDRYEEALTDYTKVVELAPTSAAAYGDLGWALLVLGRPEESMTHFDKAVTLDAYFLMERERAHLALGNLEEALADVDRDVAAHPDEPAALLRRAMLHTFEPGGCAGAAADLRRVRELSPPSSSPTWLDAAEAQVHHGHLIHSCPDLYDPDLPLQPVRSAARTAFGDLISVMREALAISLYRNGEYEEAFSSMRGAHGWIGGDRGERLFFLAMCAQKLGRSQEARGWYARGVAWMKNLPDDLFTLRFRREAEEVMGLRPSRGPS